MINVFQQLRKNIKREVSSHPKTYNFLALILVLGLFVRVYRLDALLGFYFDQGRDALVVWRLWHEGKPFLIGPVTGLAGIFLGPLYYYIIAPFYLLGGGNPVTPAVFLAFLSTIATFFLYLLGWKFHNRTTGLIAVTVGVFSLELVKASRWLANPTPILFTSMLILWSMLKITNQSQKSKVKSQKLNLWWIMIALLIGISLQFEAASAVYYIPIFLVFIIWQRKVLPSKKILLFSSLIFFATLFPQIIFNFRHENLLFNNFLKLIFEEKSFRLSFWQVLGVRADYFWSVFYSKIIRDRPLTAGIFSIASFFVLIIEKKSQEVKKSLKLILLFLLTPMIGITLFQGNFGNIFDYYLTGYYLPMILVFSLGLGLIWKRKLGKYVVLTFFILFFIRNGSLLRYYLIAGVDGPEHITMGNELQAVNWVFENSKERGVFNIDVYVPPVIPYSYDYLFLWQGTRRCGDNLCGLLWDEQTPLLYTLYEVDPPHPWRLEAWLDRQEGIGVVEEEVSFGGITVQRRSRI